jgi:hypothetical protein
VVASRSWKTRPSLSDSKNTELPSRTIKESTVEGTNVIVITGRILLLYNQPWLDIKFRKFEKIRRRKLNKLSDETPVRRFEHF